MLVRQDDYIVIGFESDTVPRSAYQARIIVKNRDANFRCLAYGLLHGKQYWFPYIRRQEKKSAHFAMRSINRSASNGA